MNNKTYISPDPKLKSFEKPTEYGSDQTTGNTGRENSAENVSPTDGNADEKVIVNEQREQKTVNAPSQTAVNSSEGISNDEDTI